MPFLDYKDLKKFNTKHRVGDQVRIEEVSVSGDKVIRTCEITEVIAIAVLPDKDVIQCLAFILDGNEDDYVLENEMWINETYTERMIEEMVKL